MMMMEKNYDDFAQSIRYIFLITNPVINLWTGDGDFEEPLYLEAKLICRREYWMQRKWKKMKLKIPRKFRRFRQFIGTFNCPSHDDARLFVI